MVLDSTRVLVVEQGLQIGCHQYICPQGVFQLPLASPRDCPRSARGLTMVPFKWSPLHWAWNMKFCIYPLNAKSLFPTVLWLSHTQDPLAFRTRLYGGLYSQCRTSKMGRLMWISDSLLLGEKLCKCCELFFLLWVSYLRVWVLTILHLCSSYRFHYSAFFISLIVENLFCKSSVHYHR